jgi:hypothetical protein
MDLISDLVDQLHSRIRVSHFIIQWEKMDMINPEYQKGSQEKFNSHFKSKKTRKPLLPG